LSLSIYRSSYLFSFFHLVNITGSWATVKSLASVDGLKE